MIFKIKPSKLFHSLLALSSFSFHLHFSVFLSSFFSTCHLVHSPFIHFIHFSFSSSSCMPFYTLPSSLFPFFLFLLIFFSIPLSCHFFSFSSLLHFHFPSLLYLCSLNRISFWDLGGNWKLSLFFSKLLFSSLPSFRAPPLPVVQVEAPVAPPAQRSCRDPSGPRPAPWLL